MKLNHFIDLQTLWAHFIRARGSRSSGQLVSLRSLRRLSNFPNEELESSRELGRDAEQLADEASLRHDIFFRDPSHPALPNHVHRFDPLQRAPCRGKGTVPFGQPRPLLHRTVILFNYVVQIFALP